ncbi:MAG: type II toxin-antitoxin system VapC family toxin [Opitutaceae bacterium]
MKLLLDTCALLHLAQFPGRLSAEALDSVLDSESELYVSAVTVAELACLQQRGRLELPAHWRVWFRRTVEDRGLNVSDLTLEIIEEAWSLPDPIHRDPADRAIIATARLERMTVITTDRLLLDYPHVTTKA